MIIWGRLLFEELSKQSTVFFIQSISIFKTQDTAKVKHQLHLVSTFANHFRRCSIQMNACSGTRVPPFFTSCMRRRFLLMHASFVMLSTTRSEARARKGVSFYLSACRFPVFLYTNCTSVYLVWQIHFFSDLEMYYAYGFVIKAMIICSSQMGVLDFGPALA